MDEIFLFPYSAPGSENIKLDEKIFEEEWEKGLKKIAVSGVKRPSLIPYIPENPNGACIILIPGGSYKRQVLNLEGEHIAKWLNSIGITAFVLKHRMPFDGHADGLKVPLQDAQRAIRLVRSNAENFNIQPNKIGVMGFSAGGHVASLLGTCFDRKVYAAIDDMDKVSARPDFMLLIYPKISVDAKVDLGDKLPWDIEKLEKIIREYSSDQNIKHNTPQTFLLVADDDKVTVPENSINFYLGLRRFGIPAELHIYKEGGHGFGLGATRGCIASWTYLCKDWLEGVISAL